MPLAGSSKSQIKIDLPPVDCAQHIEETGFSSRATYLESQQWRVFWSCIQGEHTAYLHIITSCLCDTGLPDKLFLILSVQEDEPVFTSLSPFLFKIQYAKVLDSFYYLIHAKINSHPNSKPLHGSLLCALVIKPTRC